MKSTHVLSPLSLLLALPAFAQTEPDDAANRTRVLERRRALLQQQPTHEALFDGYFKMLVTGNVVADETQKLRDKLAKDAADTASSIVLGKILLRTGKEEEALEVLDAIPAKTPEIQGVLGDLYLKLARYDMATRALEAALPGARTAEAKAGVYEKLGKAQLSLKKKDAALATWRRIGELDGGKFFRRLRVAELLAEAGLLDEAAKEYEPLLVETESDPAQHCRVLRAAGHLHELRGELDKALASYQKVLAITDRGNWLRKEIEARTVQIFRRTGRLQELVTQLEGQLSTHADDLAATEMLATVLTEMREVPRATAVLAKATPRFPKDVRLARRLAELHVEQNQIDQAIAEYQRILSIKPDELELYLELGQLFAKGERFAEAKNQWEKALARNLTDASLCVRIAAMYAMWNRREDAVRLYERAIELEPEAMTRYTDLAEYHFAQSRRDDGVAVLDRAIVKAKGSPRRLEALVGTLREHELLDRAKQCLQDWIKAEPDNVEASYSLADLLLAQGETAVAKEMFWGIVDRDDRGSGHRTMAANTLVETAGKEKALDALIAQAQARGGAGACFVLGRAHSRQRDFEQAIAAYRKALEITPEDAQARLMLARLLADDGGFKDALAEYQKLAMISPAERRRHFREIARLHLELFDLDAAMETWRGAMRDNPDNAAVFLEVGKELMQAQRLPEALEAFEQAVRLRANDPDIQLRLADALQQAGKLEAAEAQLQALAKSGQDVRDREQARSRLFDLYSENGLIERRIDELRARVEENPYDADAPHLLADLHMRTGDLVLGLEMVDKALAFQPRNRELLTRRVELLEALEEWDKALAAHRQLLEFPDADRDLHLAGVGQAQYELGRAKEAKETFKQIHDRGRVSKLYAKYELHDEAIEFYQRAIARTPGDLRNYVALAQDLMRRSRRPEAIAALEKALQIKPYYREALQELGKLYVQDNRRDEALRVGLRLFGMRGEDPERDRFEDYEAESIQRRWGYSSYQASFSQQRLQAAEQYFEERGLGQQWGGILLAEARRRPADETLLSAVRSHFGWRDKSASKLAAFLREVGSVDPDKLRVPPGYTPRSYLQMVQDALVNVWSQDAAVAEARLAELAGAEGAAAARERAVLQRSVGRLDQAEATLRELLGREPLDGVALAMLVDCCIEAKRYEDCVGPLQKLLEFWTGPAGQEALAERERRMEVSFRRQRKEMLDALPRKLRRRVTDAQLLGVMRDTRSESEWGKLATFGFPEAVPGPMAVVGKLVRVHKARNDATALAQAAERAAPLATSIADKAGLGRLLFEEGLGDAALPLLDAVLAQGRVIQQDPERVYFWSHYQSVVASAAECKGQLLAKSDKVLDAYRVLREHGHGEKAELLVRERGAIDAVRQSLQTDIEVAAKALRAARSGGVTDLRSLELDYRDAVIKLADFQMGDKDFAAAEATYQASLELLPDDLDVRKVIATLRQRRGDAAGAIAAHDEIIEVKRQRRRANAGDTGLPPTRLMPTVPGESSESSISHTGYGYWWGNQAQQQFNVTENYLGILYMHRDRSDHEAVLETLKRISREDPTTFRNMSWSVLDIIRNQDLGKKKLPILRLLKSVVANDEWLQLEYAQACSEEGEHKEAKRTLEKMLAGGTAGSYYVEQANQELTKIEQKLGEHKKTVDDLRAEVDKEPENVRLRLKLAERLRKEHLYADCLAQAQAVVERAPYMVRAKELVVEAAAATGADDVAVAMMRRVFDETTETWRKLQRGVSLTNWLYAEGKRDEAFAMMEGLDTASGGSESFSPGNWFLDRHLLEKALPLLQTELEKHAANQWYRDTVRPRVIRVEMSVGQEVRAIRRLLENIEKAGSLGDRETRWKDLLRAVKGAPDPKALRAKLEVEFGKRQSVADCLVMAATAFACGEPDRGEADLRAALDLSDKDIYIFPLLLGLRRLNADHEGALAVLERMSKVYGGSDAHQWYSGSLNERDRLKVERATIHWDMGKADEAQKLVDSLIDETKPETLQTVAGVYSGRRMLDKALELRRRYFARKGTRDRSDYLSEAALLVDMKRFAEAKALARQAHVMSRGDESARSLLTTIYKETKETEAWIAELEADYAKDIRDGSLRGALLSYYDEEDRHDDRRRILQGMLVHPDLKDDALGGLIDLCEETGDQTGKLSWLQQRLQLKGGEEKKGIWREIAEVQVKLEQPAEARASYEKALDLETAEGQMNLAEWLEEHDRRDEALVAYRKAFELDPKRHIVLAKEARAAHRAKDHGLALTKAFAYARAMRGRVEPVEFQTLFLDALAALPEAERAAALVGKPEDIASLEQASWLNLAKCDWLAAAATARAAIAKQPNGFMAGQALCAALRGQRQWRELAVAAEQLRVLYEREYMIGAEWEYNNAATTLRDEIGRCLHLSGDDEAAEVAWRQLPLRRTPYNENTGSWRSDYGVPYTAEQWMRVQRPERALSALQREFLQRESPPWGMYFDVLSKLGRGSEAEAMAWQRMLDPLELYGVTSSVGGQDHYYYYGGSEAAGADGMMRFLIEAHRKRGELAKLRERAVELQRTPRTKTQGEKLEAMVAERQRDHRFLAEVAERKLAEKLARNEKAQAVDRVDLARKWHRVGEIGKALAHMREVLDFDSKGLSRSRLPISESDWEYERVYYGGQPAQAGGTSNPFSFSFGQGSGGYSRSYSSWRRGAGSVGYRALAAILLRATGEMDKAQQVEDDVIAKALPSQRREVLDKLARAYADGNAHADAARVLQQCLSRAAEFKLDTRDKLDYLQRIHDALRRAPDATAALEANRVAWRQMLDQAIAEAPGPHALTERSQRAAFLVNVAADLPAAAAELDWLLSFAPNHSEYLRLRARVHRLQGDAARAVTMLEALAETGRESGRGKRSAIESVEFGMALAAVGRRDEAKRELVAGLADMPEGSVAEREAQAELAKLQ